MRERRDTARLLWRARRSAERRGPEAGEETPSGQAPAPLPQADGPLAERSENLQHGQEGWRPVARGLGLAAADELGLVLEARGVPFVPRRSGRSADILVPAEEHGRAMAEIAAYIAENREHLHDLRPPPATRLDLAAVGLCLSLLLISTYMLSRSVLPGLGLYPHTWENAGIADAGKIMAGQWWRAATALMLHADAAHLLGNLCVGTIFGAVLCAEIGLGCGLLAMLVSGFLGNLVNAAVLGPDHLSLGFSTAVFGAAGLIAGLRAMAGPLSGLRGGFLPLAAGLSLVAMLGSGGQHTDLGAHAFGFLVGLALGLPIGRLTHRLGPPGPRLDRICLFLGFVLPAAAWAMALR
ncbi:Peptidase S54, rhomboid domain containing protein [Desulfovibrio sp. X2]|uniref:rhomboid family intramembrane serine protease n=1 Tax=Desulfovibrio sp. X2 TaxID=941449 RepID=UPI000358AA53|nr:rhomboid family intramembrane serine protease [Desulfovibrio sp. X2]EPR44761.1 Peptidase S54, rhomboid domain containing protein [Desulfovibrio sp. X2]